MVKEIKPEEMVTQSTKAQALYDATKSGKGTPVEIRCAEAVLEQARNTERQTRAYKELSNSVKEATETAAKAAQDAAMGLHKVEDVDKRIIYVVETAAKHRLVEVIPTGVNSIVEDAKDRLEEASNIVSAQMEESAASAQPRSSKSR